MQRVISRSRNKKFEGKLLESEAQDMSKLELAEIIDIQVIQSLVDDLYKLVHISIGLNDLKGNVLVSVGWQDICTKFHRVHPETCKYCKESNIKLSSGVALGEFKAYKCKNNMWDIVTPIMVGEQHVGYVFAGQFFFEDETLDYEFFRYQARKYGFNEEEYITALEKVPRLSREAVDTSMSFLMTFANMVSQLGYGNLKLAKSLAESDILVDSLRASKERMRLLSDNLPDSAVYQCVHEPDGSFRFLYISSGIEWLNGVSVQEVLHDPNTLYRQVPPEYLEKLAEAKAYCASELSDLEIELPTKLPDGQVRWMRLRSRPCRLPDGKII